MPNYSKSRTPPGGRVSPINQPPAPNASPFGGPSLPPFRDSRMFGGPSLPPFRDSRTAPPVDEMPKMNSGVYYQGVDVTAPAAPQRSFVDMAADAQFDDSRPMPTRKPQPQQLLQGLASKKTPVYPSID